MRRILTTAATLLALTGSASAQYRANEWGAIGATGTDSIWYMRTLDMINKSNRFPQVWVKIDRSEEKRGTYRETHVLYAINCDQHGIQYLEWIDFNRDGTVAAKDVHPFNPGGYQPVIPITMSAAVEDSACGRKHWYYCPSSLHLGGVCGDT